MELPLESEQHPKLDTYFERVVKNVVVVEIVTIVREVIRRISTEPVTLKSPYHTQMLGSSLINRISSIFVVQHFHNFKCCLTMGKKSIAQLREAAMAAKSASNKYGSLGKRKSAEASSSAKPVKAGKKSASSSSSKETEDDDEDDEWSKIEKEANSEDDDEEDSDDDSEDEIKLDAKPEEISEDFTFEFNDMKEAYAEGICTLMKKYILNPSEAYSVAEIITNQSIVGTAITCEGADDCFGLATVLPLAKVKDTITMGKVVNHLTTLLTGLNSKNESSVAKLLKAVNADTTGLLFHHRFSNLPLQLIGHLHRNLEEDVVWAKQFATEEEAENSDINKSSSSSSSSGGTKTKNFFHTLSHVLLLCPVSGAEKTFDLAGVTDVLGSSAVMFDMFEDEVYFQHATSAVLFKPAKGSNCGWEQLVAVMVPVNKLKECVKGISALLPEV